MRSKSHLLKLPDEIRDLVNEMILATGPERKTYEEIAAWVQGQGFQTSKSAIDRYAKWLISMEKVKLLGDQAKAIIDQAGQDSPLRLEEATSKLGAVIMMELFQEVLQGDTVDPKKIGRLMGDFAKLQSSAVQRERLKDDFKAKVKKATDKISKRKNLDPETIRVIKEEIYGLV